MARALEPRQQVQQLALVRRHVDRRQAGRGAGRERRLQRRVGRHEQVGDVAVDRGPPLLSHGFSLRGGNRDAGSRSLGHGPFAAGIRKTLTKADTIDQDR